jgi:signal transduction histidine kinase
MSFSDESNPRIPEIDCAVTMSDELGGTSPVVHLLRMSQKRPVIHDGAHVINDDGASPIFLPQAKKSFQPIHLIVNRDSIDQELPGIKEPSTINEGSDNLKKSIELHKRRSKNSTEKKSPDLNLLTQRKSLREAADLTLLTQRIIDQEKEIKDLKSQLAESRKETDHVIQMTANVAHDLKSPLNTLMLGETPLSK